MWRVAHQKGTASGAGAVPFVTSKIKELGALLPVGAVHRCRVAVHLAGPAVDGGGTVAVT